MSTDRFLGAMKLLVFIAVALLSVWTVSSEKNRFNDLVDEVIWEMEQQMINESLTVVPIPNVSQKFAKKVLFFTIDGSIQVSGGSVGNLSTIYRVGDVVPVENDTTGALSVEGTFSMKNLTVHADLIDMKASFLHIKESITVNVGSNAASFKVSLTYDENFQCTVSLNFAKVSKLGDFHITLGQSGLLTGIEDDLANFVLNRLASTIQEAINERLYPIANKAIQKLDLCDKLL